MTIISFPCQFCAPDVTHVGRVHSPVRFCLAGASLAPCSAPYVNADSIGAIHLDSKTIRIYGADSPRKYCENAFRRLIRRFRLFSAFLKRVFSGVPFLYFTPICTATAKCRGSAKSRAFRPHRRVTARESTASEYELDRGDSMLIRFRFESENADSVRKRVSRANSSFLNIW